MNRYLSTTGILMVTCLLLLAWAGGVFASQDYQSDVLDKMNQEQHYTQGPGWVIPSTLNTQNEINTQNTTIAFNNSKQEAVIEPAQDQNADLPLKGPRGGGQVIDKATTETEIDMPYGTDTVIAENEIIREIYTGDPYTEHHQVLTYDSNGVFLYAKGITNHYVDTNGGRILDYSTISCYAEEPTIDTYDDIGMPASSLVSHKDITNDYGWEGQTILVQLNDGSIITESSDFARRNGIALQTVIAETDNNGMLIQKTVVTNSLFDVNGNAIDQTIDKFVADSSGQEKLATRTLIHNVDFDSNGNVVTQEITTYATDAAGANLEVTSYQVLTNRQFDSEHNVISQIVYTYEFAGGQLLDIQEIRSTGYNSSGVAREQDIVTYADESRTQVIEARHIQNSNIDSSGNVRLSDIYIYSGAVITGGSSGGAITFTGFLERQTISTTLFDARGNALEMQIEKAYYDPDGVLLGIDTQVITNSPYSIYNRPISSTIVNYVGMGSDKIFTDVQVIQYLSYDRYGNARHQTVDTYDDVNIVSSSLVSHKVITNTYEAVSVHDADTVTYTSPQLTSDVTSGVIDEVLSKQDAIQASRSQLSGGKFQRKSLFEDESPVQLRWNR